MSTTRRIDALTIPNGKQICFRDLPLSHQLAVVHWMAVDGEAWDVLFEDFPGELKEQLQASMPLYVAQYGDQQWGVVDVPAEAIKAAIMQDPEIADDHSTWESYHQWYLEASDVEDHGRSNRWPVILSSDNEETIMDGWHRLHSYMRAGDATVPALF